MCASRIRTGQRRIVMSTAVPDTTARRTSIPARVGLVLAGVLAIGSIVTALPQFADDPVVPTVNIVLSLLSLVAVPFAWRGAVWARVVVVVTCVLSALTGLPAFFFPGVPAEWILAAAAGIVLSLVVAVLLLVGPRSPR
jgi:hypothetical protein